MAFVGNIWYREGRARSSHCCRRPCLSREEVKTSRQPTGDSPWEYSRLVQRVREDPDAPVQHDVNEVLDPGESIEKVAGEFLRMKMNASPEELEDFLQRIKCETLRFLADDLAFQVRFELPEAAKQEDVRSILDGLQSFGKELITRKEHMSTIKWEMRKLLWELRESLDKYSPPESVRTSLEEARNALLDMSFEERESAFIDWDDNQRTSMLKYVLDESVVMFELRSLRVIVHDLANATRALAGSIVERRPEVKAALEKLQETASKLIVDEGRVRGKKRLAEAIEVLRNSLCTDFSCPIVIQERLETLRTAIFEAIQGDEETPRLRQLKGASMPLRPRLQDIPNFEVVTDVLLRGGQPSKRGIQWLVDYGVRSAVDLRGSDRENQWVPIDSWGPIKLFNIAIEDFEAPTIEQVMQFVDLAADPNNIPLFVHCKAGVGRTGSIIACWRVSHGESVGDALLKERLYSTDGGGLRQEEFVRAFAAKWQLRST